MPMPESNTLNLKVSWVEVASSSSTRRYTCPMLVNLMPLLRRFRKICLRRSGSPTTCVLVAGFMYEHISSPFSRALDATESTASSITCLRSKSIDTSSSLPASIFVRSRMSLIRKSRLSADVLICSVNLRCSAVRSVSMTSWFMPMMTLRGVRISCDMVARNWLLVSLAACACSSRASCSIRRRFSVMSCPTPMTPTMAPVTSRRVVALRRTSTLRLSLVKRGNSRLEVSLPARASMSTSRTFSR
mmetsp:Transcript_11699/g.29195  ORF Transcript_11699/g.29195 Transcript_11699/m.29195 type:complete len:245 (+) Transcript_11699:559-1293(+)